jgi:hypothetical protein
MPTFTIHLTRHAVERFQERVRPALEFADAETELAKLALVGELINEPPRWHADRCAQIAPWYLVIGDVLLPLNAHRSDPGEFVATTCLTRGTYSDDARRRRRNRRRSHRPRCLPLS